MVGGAIPENRSMSWAVNSMNFLPFISDSMSLPSYNAVVHGMGSPTARTLISKMK